jgi:hypothetical protein
MSRPALARTSSGGRSPNARKAHGRALPVRSATERLVMQLGRRQQQAEQRSVKQAARRARLTDPA